jgi:hypothetical protein
MQFVRGSGQGKVFPETYLASADVGGYSFYLGSNLQRCEIGEGPATAQDRDMRIALARTLHEFIMTGRQRL